MIASLSELHDHLADGLPVVDLLVGLVHRDTDRPGTGQTGGGQAASGQRNAVRIVGRKKSSKRCVGDSYKLFIQLKFKISYYLFLHYPYLWQDLRYCYSSRQLICTAQLYHSACSDIQC